jgi:mannose/cellobiose epimerase-like protein (N-acyl-D-glucosamine 2-epimerase family)
MPPARRGDLEEGERLAREAVALAEETDMLSAHAGALLALADVLALGGREARAELEEALALYERKGNLVMAERTRARLLVDSCDRPGDEDLGAEPARLLKRPARQLVA